MGSSDQGQRWYYSRYRHSKPKYNHTQLESIRKNEGTCYLAALWKSCSKTTLYKYQSFITALRINRVRKTGSRKCRDLADPTRRLSKDRFPHDKRATVIRLALLMATIITGTNAQLRKAKSFGYSAEKSILHAKTGMPRVDVAAQNVVYEPPIVLSCKPTTQQLVNVGRLFGFDLCCCWIE